LEEFVAWKQKIKAELAKGLEPKLLVESIWGAFWIAIFPVLGSTMFLAAWIAHWRGWNMVLVQAVQWIAYPVQLLLWYPLIWLGLKLVDRQPTYQIEGALEAIQNDFWGFAWATIVEQGFGVVAWVLLGIFLYPLGLWIGRKWLALRRKNPVDA
jgi:uncharacterized protein (DUF2062 family)